VGIPEAPEPYTPPTPSQTAPLGAANKIARAREQAGLAEAPQPGIGVGWHESVTEGHALIDNGADAYKILSDFKTNRLISRKRMGVVRAWLERLQRANAEARGALEQDPSNPDLQRRAIDAEAAENDFWKGYQPMKTEWSNIGTGMQEMRGITDADLLSQKIAEQVMREHLDQELTPSDKARAAKAVADTRRANDNAEAGFRQAIEHANRAARNPPRTLEKLRADLAETLRRATPC
jgi:hypothetical protein